MEGNMAIPFASFINEEKAPLSSALDISLNTSIDSAMTSCGVVEAAWQAVPLQNIRITITINISLLLLVIPFHSL
jgi:hypothetical protein